MKRKEPSVHNYRDIVLYLQDSLEFCKQKQNLSLRDIAIKANVNVSLLSMVLNRKRSPSRKAVAKIFSFLGLNNEEIKIAEILLKLSAADDITAKTRSLEQLNKKKKFREANPSEYEVSKYLSRWYFVAIKEMTALSDFKEDPEWIQKKLMYPVTKIEITRALKFLKKSELIRYENASLVSAQKQMICEDGIHRASLGSFHKQVLNLVSKAIDVVSREERLILGFTLTLSSEDRERAHAILTEAYEKIKKLDIEKNVEGDQAPAKEIYQIELASIPLTQALTHGGEGNDNE